MPGKQAIWSDGLAGTASRAADHDDALIARIAGGEIDVWPQLVDRHLSAVVSHSWYMLNDRDEAEDVAQEVFLRLMKKVKDWQPGGARLRTWLHRVTVNLCIDRRRAVRPEPLDTLAEGMFSSGGGEETDRGIDLERSVRGALQALNERQRAAMILVHYQGFSNIEAAATLGLSVDALESLLARARRAIRRDLEDVAGELLGDRP
jgi:RNA polymerase sigma-70 factor (ECF subfamily)